MRFKELAAGSYFFFPGSTVPHWKADDGHAVEGGSACHEPIPPDERIIPIRLDANGIIKIGYYSLPPSLVCQPTKEDRVKAEAANAYINERLQAEQQSKKPSGA